MRNPPVVHGGAHRNEPLWRAVSGLAHYSVCSSAEIWTHYRLHVARASLAAPKKDLTHEVRRSSTGRRFSRSMSVANTKELGLWSLVAAVGCIVMAACPGGSPPPNWYSCDRGLLVDAAPVFEEWLASSTVQIDEGAW